MERALLPVTTHNLVIDIDIFGVLVKYIIVEIWITLLRSQ